MTSDYDYTKLLRRTIVIEARIDALERRMNAGESPLGWERLLATVNAIEAAIASRDSKRLPALLKTLVLLSKTPDSTTLDIDWQIHKKWLKQRRVFLSAIQRQIRSTLLSQTIEQAVLTCPGGVSQEFIACLRHDLGNADRQQANTQRPDTNRQKIG